jgi:hypothetical protein
VEGGGGGVGSWGRPDLAAAGGSPRGEGVGGGRASSCIQFLLALIIASELLLSFTPIPPFGLC